MKILVTTLAAVMILGLVTMVALFVIRLGASPAPKIPATPAEITLPAGSTAQAVTMARDYTIVVTDQATVLFYTPDGTLVRTVPITE